MSESVFAALVARRSEVSGLLGARFEDPESWVAAANLARKRSVSGVMVDELSRQQRAFGASDERDRNVEKLSRAGTVAVVTGQQAGLFGGPLYTLHKAATAVARARWLETRTGQPAVPLFWLQTEDHDYAEISHVEIATSTDRVRFALPPDPTPSRTSIAHRTLPSETTALLDDVESTLGTLPHTAEVVALLRAHYVSGHGLAESFAGLIAELFRDSGLLVFDPRVEVVARAAAPLLRRILHDHDAVTSLLVERAAEISAAGCTVQVPIRPDSSLVFFHPEGPALARYRLVRRGHAFETPHGAVTQEELYRLLEVEPLRFSTSALLRPLVQDTLFPTAAYLGGPAEVSYFAELPTLYAHLGVEMPLIAPRARLRLIDPTTKSLLERLGAQAADVEASHESVLARVATRPDGVGSQAELEARLFGSLTREFDALHALGFHDLVDPIRKARDACTQSIRKLAGKVERAVVERDRVAFDRVERVRLALCPDGTPQERAYGFFGLAARAGLATLTQRILAAADSFETAPRDVLL